MFSGRKERYLTPVYTEQIETFVERHPDLDISIDEATEEFLTQCETFEEQFTDGTPLSVIRDMAFEQVKWELLPDE